MLNDALKSEKVQVERKLFFFDLKENQRGRFLRITEDVSGRRNAIVIPSGGLEEFVKVLSGIIEHNNTLPRESTPVSGDGQQSDRME